MRRCTLHGLIVYLYELHHIFCILVSDMKATLMLVLWHIDTMFCAQRDDLFGLTVDLSAAFRCSG